MEAHKDVVVKKTTEAKKEKHVDAATKANIKVAKTADAEKKAVAEAVVAEKKVKEAELKVADACVKKDKRIVDNAVADKQKDTIPAATDNAAVIPVAPKDDVKPKTIVDDDAAAILAEMAPLCEHTSLH